MLDLFSNIIDFANLHRAYTDARKCKRYRSSVLKFSYALEENLLALRTELAGKTYRHGGYREFVVIDSKKRIIKAPLFRDRVVHHALCNIIEPILDKGFIYDSYACRAGKGTHAAVARLEHFIKVLSGAREESGKSTQRIYCLACDISKYFDNVDHGILLEILRRTIKDERVLWLLSEIIQSNPQACPLTPEPASLPSRARRPGRSDGGRGIPIGNLTSQLFANIYLNELDHFVKRVVRGRYYIRYMDDFLILSKDKKQLVRIQEQIRIFLFNQLKLELHPKKARIFPIDAGIDFLGYVIRGNRRLLRKSTVKRFTKKMKRFQKHIAQGKLNSGCVGRVVQSWLGYTKYANAWRLRRVLESKLGIDFHE